MMWMSKMLAVTYLIWGSIGFAQSACEKIYEFGSPKFRGEIKANNEFDPIRDTAILQKALAQLPNEHHVKAQEKAEEILREFQTPVKKGFWGSRSGKHMVLASAWFAYFVGAEYMADVVIRDLRTAGNINVLTLHTSNFIVGIGFLGTTHHALCAIGLKCKKVAGNLALRYQQTMEKFAKKVYPKPDSIESYKGYQLKSFLITSTAFTLFNAVLELQYYMGGPNLDWPDFISGQTGVVAYYLIEKSISRRSGLISN